jgi:23S rRNA (pseudouridine1915-N3)-methyltransferase
VRITIIAVGRLKERFWTDACAEYLKRLGSYATVSVTEVADRDASGMGEGRALASEAADVMKALPDSAHVIALDIAGRTRSSEEFSRHLSELGLAGRSSISFVIGGSHGLAHEVLTRANERLSFGPMTLPHNLARVVLLEQLYRAFRIARGEPYHK